MQLEQWHCQLETFNGILMYSAKLTVPTGLGDLLHSPVMLLRVDVHAKI